MNHDNPQSHRDEGDEAGMAALELALIVPFVLIVLLLIVGVGRVERGREIVDQAAEAASRAASLTFTPGDAQKAAQTAANRTLRDGGMSCRHTSVVLDTSQFHNGGVVTAALSCQSDLSDLALSGLPGSTTLTSRSTSPIDTYRSTGQP